MGIRTVTILSGASLSGALDIGPGHTLVAIRIPAAWTTAGLTFQCCEDGATFGNFYQAGAEYSIASAGVVAGGYISVSPGDFAGVRGLKVRSGTSGSPVNQGADRILTLVTLPL